MEYCDNLQERHEALLKKAENNCDRVAAEPKELFEEERNWLMYQIQNRYEVVEKTNQINLVKCLIKHTKIKNNIGNYSAEKNNAT